MPSDQTIISEITQEIINALPDWYGPEARLLDLDPIRLDREFTIFFHYTVIDQDERKILLILKMPRDNWMTSLEEIIDSAHLSSFTKREAAILMKIEEAVDHAEDQGLGAIHVLAYLDDFCVTVMEELPFKTYKRTHLKTPTAFLNKKRITAAFQHIHLAGKWLKLYHDTFSEDQKADTQDLDLIAEIDSMLDQLGQSSAKARNSLRQQFARMHAGIQSQPLPLTTLHNDFHLSNVLINQDNQIGGFDPNPDDPDSIYVDIARAITDCETQQVQVLTSGLFFSQTFIEQIKTGFLQGYGAKLNQVALDFYCAITVLKKWLWTEQVFADSWLSRIPGMKLLLHYQFRRYFLRLINYYL